MVLRAVVVALSLLCVGALDVQHKLKDDTPMSKVVELLEDMKSSLEEEFDEEYAEYSTFACNCQDTTDAKSQEIRASADKIDENSADIAAKTAEHKLKTKTLGKKKALKEQKEKALADEEARCEKEDEVWNQRIDLAKLTLVNVENAISALQESQASAGADGAGGDAYGAECKDVDDAAAALLQTRHKEAAQKIMAAMKMKNLRPDEYKSRNQGVIATLTEIKNDLDQDLQDKESEQEKAQKACAKNIKTLKTAIADLKTEISQLKSRLAALVTEIGQHRATLVSEQVTLKDLQLFMKDLTAECHARAKDWDQRKAMRNEEIGTIDKALEILGDAEGNFEKADDDRSASGLKKCGKLKDRKAGAQAFLQTSESDDRVAALRDILADGKRLNSTMLLALAARASGDPFAKVKKYIQALLERLLQESIDEATKEGVCDEVLGKARKTILFNQQKVDKAVLRHVSLRVKKESLEEAMRENWQSNDDTDSDQEELHADWEHRHALLVCTLENAQASLEATRLALDEIKKFYAHAGRGKVVLLQASPIDEADSGFNRQDVAKGAYTGSQDSSKAIIGLLEVMENDYVVLEKRTREELKTGKVEFNAADRRNKVALTKQSVTIENSMIEWTSVTSEMDTLEADLEDYTAILDASYIDIEEHRSMCLDTGMSFEEKTKKRKAEIAALKKACTKLGGKGSECK